MTAHDSRNGSARPMAIAGLFVLGVALGVWWMSARTPSASEALPAAAAASARAPEPTPEAPQPAPSPPSQAVRAPAQRIADQGRLSVTREALREGDVLALGLELPDELRGFGPRPVKVVDLTGRVLEGLALPVDGPGSGLRLEIDPEWLQPGRYMIQLETSGGAPLPLRRYVLEVQEDAAS